MIGIVDGPVRSAVFDWLTEQRGQFGEALARTALENFTLDGRRVPLVGPQGIFKPRVCEVPLSITTVAGGPYSDTFDEQTGTLRYAYRGTDPGHRDNVGLRRAMAERVPLVYFHGVRPGVYVAAYPVFVVRDDPARLTFTMQVDDISAPSWARPKAILSRTIGPPHGARMSPEPSVSGSTRSRSANA